MSTVFEDIRASFNQKGNFYMRIIIINVMVFLFAFLLRLIFQIAENGNEFIGHLNTNLALNAPFFDFIRKPWTLITFIFTQNNFFDLLFNMLGLFYFGYILQDYIGGLKFLNSYILGALSSAFAYMIVFNSFELLSNKHILLPLVHGCSAGVFSVIFSSVAVSQNHEFNLFGLLRIKIKYLALIFLLLSFSNLSHGLVALFGAAFGYLYIKLLRTGIDLGAPFQSLANSIIKLFTKKSKPPVTYRRNPEYVKDRKQQQSEPQNWNTNTLPTEAEVNALLDKISRTGYASLSSEEKNRLYLASKKKD